MAVFGIMKSYSIASIDVSLPNIPCSLYAVSLETGISGIISQLLAATGDRFLQFTRFLAQSFTKTVVGLDIDHIQAGSSSLKSQWARSAPEENRTPRPSSIAPRLSASPLCQAYAQ
jgi:hypothetical protein